MDGDIVSWCFEMEKPNNVSHTFIAINPQLFGETDVAARTESVAEHLRNAPKAKGSTRIYTPGEMEWEKHVKAEQKGIDLPADVTDSLQGLANELSIKLPIF